MSAVLTTSAAFTAAAQLENERLVLRRHIFNTFQNLTDFLKETYGADFGYERRYTYIGPRVARTKFFGTKWNADSETTQNILNRINTRYKGVLTAQMTGTKNNSLTVYLNS